MRIASLLVLSMAVSASPSPAAAQGAPTGASHEAAASDLVDVMKLEEMTKFSMDMMMSNMLDQNPMLEQFRDVFVEFFGEHMQWDALRPEYVKMYAEAFSEPEIRELIAFYETPVGAKSVELTPVLMHEGALMGQRMIEPHLPDLQRRIEERLRGGG